jgi:tetratricopeptide (TPR) repeat protein
MKPSGFWSIAGGGEGQNCTATWSLPVPVPVVADTTLTFEMQFEGFGAENLGRFRLSVSGDRATVIRESQCLAATTLTDRWGRVAAGYGLVGDPQALCKLLSKLVTDRPEDGALLKGLARAYQSAGRTREAVPYMARASAVDPTDTMLSLRVAAFQAWFGQEKELAATRRQILAFAKDTNDASRAEEAAKACSILASTNKSELGAALALARKGAELDKGGEQPEWRLLALGMAEYRSGNDAAADEALAAAAQAGPNDSRVSGISAFYRAMSLFRQGKKDDARMLATAAAATMKPLPTDEQNPLTGGARHDDLILWLAYKEAEAMIEFDVGAPSKTENDKN